MLSPQRLFLNFFRYVGHHPDRILDWTMVFAIAILLLRTLMGLGGYLPYGETLIGPLGILWGLMALHALWWVVRRGDVVFRPWALLPVPLLLWGAFEVHFVSSAPWWGGLAWSSWVAGWLVFWLVAHQLRTRLQLIWLFVLCVLIGATAAAVGLYQDYFDPSWFPIAGRERAAQYAGRAAGFFGVPNNLAAFLLLTWPATVVIAAFKRFPGPIRLLSLALSVAFLAAIVSTGSRGGLIGLFAVAMLLPWLIMPTFKQRLAVFCWFVLGGIYLLFSAYSLSSQFRERIELAVHDEGEVTRPVMWEAALNMLGDNPVVGQGLGGFEAEWELFRGDGPSSDPHYAHNDYLQLGAETGGVGFLLGAGVGLASLIWLFLRGRKIGFFQLAPGQDIRVLESVGLAKPKAPEKQQDAEEKHGHHHRRRRRKRKKHWAVSFNKPLLQFTIFIMMVVPVSGIIFLKNLSPLYLLAIPPIQVLGNIVIAILRDEGSVQRTASGKLIGIAAFTGLLAVAVHALFDFPFQIPVILWTAAVLLALGLRATEVDGQERHLPRPALYGLAAVLLGTATFTYVYAAPRLLAQERYYLAMEGLQYAERNPDAVLRDPALAFGPATGFNRARLLNPDHGAAWLGEGRAVLLENQGDLSSRPEHYAAKAMPLLEQGRELYPAAWEGYLYQGLAAWMLNRPQGEVVPLLEAAIEHAPYRPQAYVMLADYLWSNGGSEERVSSLLDQAYALDPNYGPTVDLRLRIGLD